MSATHSDTLSFPAEAIPRSRPGALTLRDCARTFSRHLSPRVIGAALVGALALRLAVGRWEWQDALVPAYLILSEPFTEWLIHVYILHSPGVRIAGRTIEPLAAREHRAHHSTPTELHWVFIPRAALAALLPAIAVLVFLYALIAHALAGGSLLGEATSGLLAGYAILAAYEWCHFLIHTPYRPRRWYYRLIWRNHRLHHYKNEHYWFGVTNHLGDVALHTNPEQGTVPRSPTARALGSTPTG
ncbi:MAG: sterol desaturase family protein [Acidobacteriota bacterium]|nr:sterol desaturase family protein [Acidobacteriota bacterium]